MAMKPCFLDVSRRIQLKKKSGKSRKIPTLMLYNKLINSRLKTRARQIKKDGTGISKMNGRDFPIPENPDPGKILAPNCRVPEWDSGFLKNFKFSLCRSTKINQ
jgi:hypothetical protein